MGHLCHCPAQKTAAEETQQLFPRCLTLIGSPKPLIALQIGTYRFRQEPSHCNFGRSVQDEGLADRANDLACDDEGEVGCDEASKGCSDGGEDCADHDALFDSSDVEDPVGWEVDKDVDDHVAHGDDGDDGVGLAVGAGDGDRDGTDDDPAHAVDEGEEAEHGHDGHAIAVLSVLVLDARILHFVHRDRLLSLNKPYWLAIFGIFEAAEIAASTIAVLIPQRLRIISYSGLQTIMTLRIMVDQFKTHVNQDVQAQLYVIGSKAGPLVSTLTVSKQQHKWNPRFVIDCSQNDNLEFTLFYQQAEQPVELGRTTLSCLPFIQQEKAQNNFPSKVPLKYELTLHKSQKIVGSLSLWISYEPALLFEGQFSARLNLSLKVVNPNRVGSVVHQVAPESPSKSEMNSFERQLERGLKQGNQSREPLVDAEDSRLGREGSEGQKKSSEMWRKGSKLQSGQRNIIFYMGKCPTVNAFSFFDEAVNGQKCSFSESLYRDKK